MDVDRDTYITAENKAKEDNDELRFFTAGVENMRIDEEGNVGIQERYNGSDPYNQKVALHVGGTNAIHIPTGTTLERPDADSAFEQIILDIIQQKKYMKVLELEWNGDHYHLVTT